MQNLPIGESAGNLPEIVLIYSLIDFPGELGTTGSENSRQVGGHIIVLAVGTETNEAFARARALGPAYDSYSTWWFRF